MVAKFVGAALTLVAVCALVYSAVRTDTGSGSDSSGAVPPAVAQHSACF